VIRPSKTNGSWKSGKMSQNATPFLGKSEYVLRWDLIYSRLDIMYELAGIHKRLTGVQITAATIYNKTFKLKTISHSA